jgi:UDP-GlcNAc:undecaprenyl-phosphate GlcNAc-1-phosphate transferase
MLVTVFSISLILSLVGVPIIRKYSNHSGIVAAPRDDRWHTKPTPKIGGIGIFLAFVTALVCAVTFYKFEISNWPLLIGSGLIFILGVTDDFKRISPPAKLIGEIIAAAFVVFFGRNIDFFSDNFLNIIVTFLWLVGITNAINLLDNMDGLAGGVSLVAACLLSFLFYKSGATDLLVISLGLAGSLLGFLFFNFPPASIFMGDSGALFLGFTLSALAIARVPQASNLLAVMGVPTLLFLLPILDTLLVTITRILRGQSPADGGRDHTSHRLIAFGLTEKQVVLILYAVAILSGIFGVILESIDYTISLVLIPILLVTLALLTAYLGRLKFVTSGIVKEKGERFSSFLIGLTYRGRILEIALDLFIISITYYLAYWIHFGTQVEIITLDIFINSLPLALAGTYTSFLIFGIYKGVWQYMDIRDMLRYSRAVIGGVSVTAGLMSWMYYPLNISLRIFIIFAAFLLLGLIISRSTFTILDHIYNQRIHNKQKKTPVLIYGAGDNGILLVQWLSQDSRHHLNPVGFLDDDPYKLRRQILGIQVLGNIMDIQRILSQTKVEGILLSSGQILSPENYQNLKNICQEKGVWLKSLNIEIVPVD